MTDRFVHRFVEVAVTVLVVFLIAIVSAHCETICVKAVGGEVQTEPQARHELERRGFQTADCSVSHDQELWYNSTGFWVRSDYLITGTLQRSGANVVAHGNIYAYEYPVGVWVATLRNPAGDVLWLGSCGKLPCLMKLLQTDLRKARKHWAKSVRK